MKTTIPRLPRALPAVAAPAALRTRLLPCATCGTWTPHALNNSETAYVCACGTEIVYVINSSPRLWAIK